RGHDATGGSALSKLSSDSRKATRCALMMPPRSPKFRKDWIHSAVGLSLSGMLQTKSPRFCFAGTGPERRFIGSIRPELYTIYLLYNSVLVSARPTWLSVHGNPSASSGHGFSVRPRSLERA